MNALLSGSPAAVVICSFWGRIADLPMSSFSTEGSSAVCFRAKGSRTFNSRNFYSTEAFCFQPFFYFDCLPPDCSRRPLCLRRGGSWDGRVSLLQVSPLLRRPRRSSFLFCPLFSYPSELFPCPPRCVRENFIDHPREYPAFNSAFLRCPEEPGRNDAETVSDCPRRCPALRPWHRRSSSRAMASMSALTEESRDLAPFGATCSMVYLVDPNYHLLKEKDIAGFFFYSAR